MVVTPLTCLAWALTMILYLSRATAMIVKEDMKAAMQGKVLTNLHTRYKIYITTKYLTLLRVPKSEESR